MIDCKTCAASAPQLTDAQKQRLADIIATAMVQLLPLIVQTVGVCRSSLQDSQ